MYLAQGAQDVVVGLPRAPKAIEVLLHFKVPVKHSLAETYCSWRTVAVRSPETTTRNFWY